MDGGSLYHDARLGLGWPCLLVESELPRGSGWYGEGTVGNCAERFVALARLHSIEEHGEIVIYFFWKGFFGTFWRCDFRMWFNE